MLDTIKDILKSKTSTSFRHASIPLGIIASLIVATVWHMVFRSQLQSISIFLVIPFGSIALGAVAGYVYFAGRYIYNLPIRKTQYAIAALIGVCMFALTHYIDYRAISYNENTGALNTLPLNKTPGDVYLHDEISFAQYMQGIIHSDIEFSRSRGGSATVSYDWVIYVYFAIQFLGSIIGAVGAVLFVTGARRYCDECKTYDELKKLFKFPSEPADNIVKALQDNSTNPAALNTLINEQTQRYHETLPYGEVNIGYCPHCFDAHFEIYFSKSDDKGKAEPDAGKNVSISILAGVAGDLDCVKN
jgi:hypothetical protein